jgi:hypothetical protein
MVLSSASTFTLATVTPSTRTWPTVSPSTRTRIRVSGNILFNLKIFSEIFSIENNRFNFEEKKIYVFEYSGGFLTIRVQAVSIKVLQVKKNLNNQYVFHNILVS